MTLDPGRYRNVIVRGGIQRRTLFKMRPRQSPALNRIPLVRWQWYYAYLTGTRVIMPTHLNNPHSLWHSSPTGCILRFALLNDRATLETAAKWESQAIIRDAGSACYPGLSRLRDVPLKQEVSRRYTGSRDPRRLRSAEPPASGSERRADTIEGRPLWSRACWSRVPAGASRPGS